MTLALQTKKEILASQIAYKRRLNNEERLYRELSKFFKKLKKEVLSSLEEYWSDYQMLQGHINLICAPVHEAHREYYEILGKHALQEYKLGKEEGTRLVKRANAQTALKATKDLPIDGFITKNSDELFGTLPKAEQDLLNRIYKTSEQTLSRVDGQLNQIITEGYVKGKGIDSVANDLTKRFNQLSTWEAKRIARTEMNTSHNMATMDAYQELGVEYTQWIAANDDRTRDSHVEVDREIIPFGGTYSNGLQYPGDKSGPIEEWINCRCSNAPFVIPYGYMAPSFSPFREDDLIPIENVRTADELLQPTEPQLSSEEIPPNVQLKMDEFSKEYINSRQEHMQFFTNTSSSEVTHGKNASVRVNRSQEEFMETQTKKGEEVHGIHTHPNQHERYTMLSHEDIIDGFLPRSSKLKSFSAENKRNRVTIIKTRDDFLKITKPSKVSSMIELTAHGQVNKAWSHYRERMEKIRSAPDEAMLWKRQRRKELREKGLSSYEIGQILDNEIKTKHFKTLEEIQDEEYPKIVEEMNEMLTPFGLKIKVKYKN